MILALGKEGDPAPRDARALEYWAGSLGLFAGSQATVRILRGASVLVAGDLRQPLPSLPKHLAPLAPDLFGLPAALLDRDEETEASARDSYGNFLACESILSRLGLLQEPVLDQAGHLLLGALDALAQAGGPPVLRKLPWPAGAPMAASLGHDIDDPLKGQLLYGTLLMGSGLLRLRHASLALGWDRTIAWLRHGGGAGDPYLNFARYRELESAQGVRSTFFVVTILDGDFEVRYRFDKPPVRQALLDCVEAGWEVAVHGSNHSASDGTRLARERERLADLVGPVSGIRQHNLRWSREGSWRRQAAAGFRYDSSVAYNEALGFRAGAAFPYRCTDTAGREVLPLWELPLSLMETYLCRRADPEKDVLHYLDAVRAVGGVLVVNWHERVLHEPDFPGMGRLYGVLLDGLKRAGAWVPTARDLVDWWEARAGLDLVALKWEGEAWTCRLKASLPLRNMVLEIRDPGRRWVPEGPGRIDRQGDAWRAALPDLSAGNEIEMRLRAKAG